MASLIVGYDGTDSAKAALEEAISLAKDLDDEVVIVFGYAPPGTWGGEIAEHEEAVEELGEKVTAEAVARATEAGVAHQVQLKALRPSRALLAVVEERDARMMVVGSHNETPLKGAIIGSTPYKLLHESEIPVLVVPVPR
jgi:nucleotide-binding universal stress UspA family protein